tara:strand:+ start:3295 stop:5007 length:1713 start_codon:yes stop_codon:yes gene_type:complete
MDNKLANNTIFAFILILLIVGLYSSIITGFSWDEYFHHINGNVRFRYYATFGEVNQLDFRNIKFYPGLYDTLSYSISHIIFLLNKNFFINYLAEIMHTINFLFSALSILGLYLLSKKIFNKRIALLASMLTLLNPFFFGHMGINSKDVIIFFSLIWFCYFFYKYLTEEEKVIKNLLYSSFFLGFGCGVRLSFPVVIIPVIIPGIIYLIIKYRYNYWTLFKRIVSHSLIAIIVTTFLVLLCWPHMLIEIQKGNFVIFFSEIVKNTLSWIDGPKIGLINGEFYEVFNTPKTYFISILKHRMPFYSTFLVIISIMIFFKKDLLIKQRINYFNIKFIVLLFICFFPIFLFILMDVNIYDNVRLFIFIIPFFCLISAFALDFLLSNFNSTWSSKIGLVLTVTLFSLSFYRFIYLTPYQYSYVNFSYPKYQDSLGKFELDYWGASYKELVKEIKNNHTQEEISKFKIADCGGGDFTLIYYMNKYLGLNQTYSDARLDEATHIVMNNRAFLDVFENNYVKNLVNQKDGSMLVSDMVKVVRAPGVKQMCYDYNLFSGEETAKVTRGKLPLTVFRKIDK